MIFVIDPLAIATDGVITSRQDQNPTLRLYSLGFLVTIEEQIITPILPSPSGGGGGVGGPKSVPKKKRFTIRVNIDDVIYTDSIETENLQVTVKDIRVELNQSTGVPSIKITIVP